MDTFEYKKGTHLFATQYSADAIEIAKLYITENGYSSETVKMVRDDNDLLLVIKL